MVVSGHADWLEVLALASKHRYADLFTRCTNFLLEQARERPVLLATNFITGSQQLKELRQASAANQPARWHWGQHSWQYMPADTGRTPAWRRPPELLCLAGQLLTVNAGAYPSHFPSHLCAGGSPEADRRLCHLRCRCL